MPLRFERLQRPDCILDRDRLAVMPARFGTEREGDPAAVFRPFDGFRQQAVFGERLILRRFGERFIHSPNAPPAGCLSE